MKQIFDLLEAINEQVMLFAEQHGQTPDEVCVAREAYRRLIEIRADETRIGNLVIGCVLMTVIETALGNVRLSIDEMLSETEVKVA